MSNLRRPLLEIPSDAITGASVEVRRFFDELNARFRTIAEQHEASAGLRGTVRIAAQKADARGVTSPGLLAGANRIANAADPVDLQDGLTYGFLKKWLTCERLVGILEDCFEFEELLDNTLDPDALPAATPGAYNHVIHLHAIKPPQETEAAAGTAAMDAANECWAFLFHFPADMTVSKIVYAAPNAGGAGPKLSIGLYDLDRNLVLDTGPFNAPGSNFDVSTISIAPVVVRRGMYYLAHTSDTVGPTLDRVLMQSKAFANQTAVREGKATPTSGAALNTSLGTITAFTDTNAHSAPFVMFE